MITDNKPRLALDLEFDSKNRLTWREPLREQIPSDIRGLRVVWNGEAGRFEAYPLE